MNERIKELAEQAGLEELGDGDWCSLNHPDVRAEHLERFAELVRQDERKQAEKQEPAVEHLWECLGRWSSYLAVNGTEANLAPPNWLLDAVIAATSQPRKEWVGLTDEDTANICMQSDINNWHDEQVIDAVEAKLKEKNT